MLLSGLDNIDFSGISGLSGDMSRAELFAQFRSALPSTPFVGVSDDQINAVLDSVFSKYEIRRVQIPDDLAATIQADVSKMVIAAFGAGKAGLYQSNILGVTNGLSQNGLALVPIGYSAQSQSSGGSATAPVQSMGPVYGTQAYGQPPAPLFSAQPHSAAPAPNSGGGRVLPRTIFRQRAQTPLEKKRLLYIISGFGVMFAVALGLIAARGGSE